MKLINNNFSVLSYNIWFSKQDRDKRTNELINLIKKYDPTIICLQEVTNDVYKKILSLLENDNMYFYVNNHYEKNYFCLIISKYEIKNKMTVKLKSNMGRELQIITIDIGIPIIIMNTHCESVFYGENISVKYKQYDTISKIAKNINNNKNIVIAMDGNVGNNDEVIFSKNFCDFDNCMDKSKHKNKYTYDSYNNYYLKMNNQKNKFRSNPDKMLHSKTINCISSEIIEESISDHFGILSKFEILSVISHEE